MWPGRARAAILLAALALASLFGPFASSAQASPYHLMDAQEDTTSPLEQPTEANLAAAQSFTPARDFTLTRVSLFVVDRGNNDDLPVLLVPDALGVPNTGTILAAGTNNSDSNYEWADYTLAPAVSVIAGTTYWIVADANSGTGNGYAWRYSDLDLFPTGNAATASGNSWTVLPGDFSFRVYGWTAPTVAFAAIADRALAASGDSIRYTISLTNTGTEDATDVWVNATLDGRLRFTNATGPGTVAVAGQEVTFRVAALPTGTLSFFLAATVGTVLADGGVLDVPISVDFFDGVSRPRMFANPSVEILAPDIVTTLATSSGILEPGAIVTFEVNLTNRGRTAARHVWLNESLHSALTFLSDTSPVPPSQDGPRQSWHFADVAPGTTRFNVTVQVHPQTTDETAVANFLSVEYTDRNGGGLVRARSNTVWFSVGGTAGTDPWLWGSFIISATIVAGTYVGYARRRLRMEEIFLIHHSGVLLVHMSKSMKADHDSDILSGMFTAIMNFVRDAFHYEGRQELQGLDLGQYRVHVRKGGITYLALVHTGRPTRWIGRAASQAVAAIEGEYGDLLRDWNGDVHALVGVRDLLKGHFLSPTGPSRSGARLRAFFARLDQSFKPMRPL